MLNTNEVAAIYAAHSADITRVCAKYLGKRFGADHTEEMAQEMALLLITRILPAYEPSKGDLGAFIRQAVANACKNYLALHRNNRHAAPTRGDDGKEIDPVDALACDATPFEAMARADLGAALSRLTERQRALVTAYLDLGSWGQAAAAIGVSNATASRIKAEAVDALRAIMAE